MTTRSLLFRRLMLLCSVVLGFGAFESAAACIPVELAAASAPACHSPDQRQPAASANCVLLCGAIEASVAAVPRPMAIGRVVYVHLDTSGEVRSVAPDPPHPRSA